MRAKLLMVIVLSMSLIIGYIMFGERIFSPKKGKLGQVIDAYQSVNRETRPQKSLKNERKITVDDKFIKEIMNLKKKKMIEELKADIERLRKEQKFYRYASLKEMVQLMKEKVPPELIVNPPGSTLQPNEDITPPPSISRGRGIPPELIENMARMQKKSKKQKRDNDNEKDKVVGIKAPDLIGCDPLNGRAFFRTSQGIIEAHVGDEVVPGIKISRVGDTHIVLRDKEGKKHKQYMVMAGTGKNTK